MGELVYLRADDWEGAYFEGELEAEGHAVGLDEVAHVVPAADIIKTFTASEEGLEWMRGQGRFPQKLADVPMQHFEPYLGYYLDGEVVETLLP